MKDPCKKVVACVDFSESSHRVIEQAIRVAQQDEASLRLLHVFSAPWKGVNYVRQPSLEDEQHHSDALKERVQVALEPFESEMRTLHVETDVGENARESDGIVQFIVDFETDLVVVGTRGRVGAQAAVVFGKNAVGIASAGMTLLVLVVSEITPKTLGAVHAKSLALPAAMTIRLMIIVCLPVIVLLERVNRVIAYRRHEERINRAELLATIRLGRASGALGRREYQIASNLVALSTIRLSEVLTPRTVVFSLDGELTVRQVLAEYDPIRFSRIPVYGIDPEYVTGYVSRFAIRVAHSANEGTSLLKELAKPITILPELAAVGIAMEAFNKDKQHIALVVDEYGGMSGIVTLEDLPESLLGVEIVDETDTVADMRELAW